MQSREVILVLAVAAALAACKKTGENEYQVKLPEIEIRSETATVRVPEVDVGTKVDTVNAPVIGTKKDTIVVDKPVIGTKRTEIERPTTDAREPKRP